MEKPRENPRPKKKYTYEDYLTWPEDEHWEIIEGEAYPTYGPEAFASPSLGHQGLLTELIFALRSYLKDKPCRVYTGMDTLLDIKKDKRRKGSVVQPDIAVVCNDDQLNENYIEGAPTFIIEILSKSTMSKDNFLKRDLYRKHGVKEYWIVSQYDLSITQLILKGEEQEINYIEEGKVESFALPGFSIVIEDLKASLL